MCHGPEQYRTPNHRHQRNKCPRRRAVRRYSDGDSSTSPASKKWFGTRQMGWPQRWPDSGCPARFPRPAIFVTHSGGDMCVRRITMYEVESNSGVESVDQVPAEIIARFREFRDQVGSRTVLPWSEHCTECVWPTCYSTCEFYSPREDG